MDSKRQSSQPTISGPHALKELKSAICCQETIFSPTWSVEDHLCSLVLAVRLNDFWAIIRGSIVEDDELDVLESLGQNAIAAFRQVLRMIIIRHTTLTLLGILRVLGGV